MVMTMWGRWRPVAALAVFSAAILTGSLAMSATSAAAEGGRRDAAAAGTSGPGREALERMERQRPLVAAADVIRAAVDGHASSPYAGLVLRESHVDVYWKGTLPAAMRRVVDRASKSAPVQVHPAAYSVAELRSAARKIEAGWQGSREDLQAIKMQPDGSGLIVSVPESTVANRRSAKLDVGVPITTIGEGAFAPMSRGDDYPPWAGGARIRNGTRSSTCSSGFGVRNSAGAHYVLTAAHCGVSGDRFVDGQGELIGYMGPRNTLHDIALIPTSRVDGAIYKGDWYSELVHYVHGWGATHIGEYVCQSGQQAASNTGGPICDLVVSYYRADVSGLVEAVRVNGNFAAYPGDSGGPVYVHTNGGVSARGTVSGGINGSRAILVFQEFAKAYGDWSVYPVTRFSR